MKDHGETLFDDYWFEAVSEQRYRTVYEELSAEIFEPDLDLAVAKLLTEQESASIAELGKNMGTPYSLNLIIYCKDQIIGWSHGRQESDEKFYMVNSGVLKLHRNKGIYTCLLPRIMARVLAKGFQLVYSKHAVTNNQVIVPKLKQGFVISGLEISDANGILVTLSYFSNPIRRQAMDFRAGLGTPGSDLLQYLPKMN